MFSQELVYDEGKVWRGIDKRAIEIEQNTVDGRF
jgi:hypothetical protein